MTVPATHSALQRHWLESEAAKLPGMSPGLPGTAASHPRRVRHTKALPPFSSYINMIWTFHRVNYVLSCHVSIILLTAFILPDMIWKVQIRLPFNCVILAKINTDIVQGWHKTMANPWEQDRTLVAQRVPRNLHASRQVCLSSKCRRRAGGGFLPRVSFPISKGSVLAVLPAMRGSPWPQLPPLCTAPSFCEPLARMKGRWIAMIRSLPVTHPNCLISSWL